MRPDVTDKMLAIQNQLHHLYEVLKILTSENCKSERTILTRKGCKLNENYVKILHWLVQRNILPEITKLIPGSNQLIWDFKQLNNKYDQRRRKLGKYTNEFIGPIFRRGLLIDSIADNLPDMARAEWNYHRNSILNCPI